MRRLQGIRHGQLSRVLLRKDTPEMASSQHLRLVTCVVVQQGDTVCSGNGWEGSEVPLHVRRHQLLLMTLGFHHVGFPIRRVFRDG